MKKLRLIKITTFFIYFSEGIKLNVQFRNDFLVF